MSESLEAVAATLTEHFGERIRQVPSSTGELTVELARGGDLTEVATALRDELGFEMLMDLCGVDYLLYGVDEWKGQRATGSGFSRGVSRSVGLQEHEPRLSDTHPRRFGVVLHLQSIQHNLRMRLRAYCESDEAPMIASLTGVWPSADWYEREAFDLFGILFDGHPDLRRLLTDYGFIGHPFRKDFPLSGHVQVRYDPAVGRVAYEPVDIEPRTLVPKVIREDHRYEDALQQTGSFRDAPATQSEENG
ncbi:MAG: NADH-quinone oxidoreductase subunit C [Pseudomonadota bacterium]